VVSLSSRRWCAVLVLALVLTWPPVALAAALSTEVDGTGIQVEVVRDEVTAEGWRQTVALTFRPGGTVAAAALVVYGDEGRSDDLFAVVQRQHPEVPRPDAIPAGLVVTLTIDPTRVFVRQQEERRPGVVTRVYTNGVREHLFAPPQQGVVRRVTFPVSPTGAAFAFRAEDQIVTVPSGGSLVDLVSQAGQSYPEAVQAVFGFARGPAALEFSRQTGWTVHTWPPPPGERRRLVLGPVEQYRQWPAVVAEPTATDPLLRERQRDLLLAQQQAGIIVQQRRGWETLYRVAAVDPAVTARQVSQLIYGTPDRALEIAQRAGFALPPAEVARDRFDPSLFGLVFDLAVDLAHEQFIATREGLSEGERLTLVNGTRIERYRRTRGLVEMVRYPTGFARLVYRPGRVLSAGAHLLAFLRGVGVAARDPAAARAAVAAQVVWHWAPDLPHRPGEMVESLAWEQRDGEPVLVAVVAPGPERGPVGTALLGLWAVAPYLGAVVLLGGVSGIVVVVALLAGRRSLG
jgi:hypothetical protein